MDDEEDIMGDSSDENDEDKELKEGDEILRRAGAPDNGGIIS